MENGLEAELDEDLGYSRYDYKNKATDNSRNGHSSKTLRTSFGDVEVSVPRDRKGEFEPQGVTPKFCVKSNECRNRAKFICRRQRLDRLPPMSTT